VEHQDRFHAFEWQSQGCDMTNLAAHERLMRQMVQICPFRIGQRVTLAPSYEYAAAWPGEYVIVGLTWEYTVGAGHDINVGLASDDDIVNRYGGWTNGFLLKDLVPVSRS
jgi:hypothetical protein